MFQMLGYITPILKKFKYLAVLVIVFFIAYFVTWRWRQTFQPQWLYIGAVVGITAVVILIILFVQWRHGKKMEQGLEAGITATDEDKVDLKGEIQALRDNWRESLARLKESAGAKSAAATLHTLPWYIIIGEPASGKSTLLRKSGLDFPVGDAALSGMHGTRNCDWWFANEAIFLDTAGRYIIETQESEWVTFLGLLKKYRKTRPINGVLVAVAANSLLTKSHEDLLDDAKRIRARLDELIDELGINFPTYILVTKCDLISGFVEFFGPLDGRHRDEMVGWTNPPDPSAKFDAAEFDTRFSEVSEKLFHMRPWLEGKGSKKGLMRSFLFPEEFSYLQQPLRTVLDSAFKPNIYQETPVCRGVYFSSGTQVGSPLAMALDDMAKDLNVVGLEELGLVMGSGEEKEVRTYFIKDFVSEQVLKDRDMNWRTKAAEARLKKRRMGWGMIGVAAAALVLLFGTSSFLSNRGRLTDFKAHLPEAGRPLEVAIGCMKAHDEAVPPGVLDIGLNYSDDLMPSFRATFHRLFTQGILDPMVDALKAQAAEIPSTMEGHRDVDGYRDSYSHYLYLRDGLAGNFAEEYDKSTELEHLDALMAILDDADAAGGATAEDLRAAIRRFGETAGLDGLAEHRRREVESAYAGSIGAWLDHVGEWVTAWENGSQGRAAKLEEAIEELTATASRKWSHQSVPSVYDRAGELRDAANSGKNPEVPALDTVAAGLRESEDRLRSLLLEVKQSLPEGDAAVGKIDDLHDRLSVPAESPEVRERDEARKGLVAFLDGLLAKKDGFTPATYEAKPDLDSLASHRRSIGKDLERTRERAFDQIRDHVAALGGEPETQTADGKVQINPGWWDTFVLLAQAQEADHRMQEYLDEGLRPLLAGAKWKIKNVSDRETQIYTVSQLQEIVVPRLREQTKFFESELVATRIRDEARKAATDAFVALVDAMEAWYLKKFDDAVPGAGERAATLADAFRQAELWTARRSPLLRAGKAVRESMWDIDRLVVEGDDGEDPVILGSQERRRQAFDKLAIFFDFDAIDDDRDLPSISFQEAKDTFSPLVNALNEVAGLGTENQVEALKLAARVLESPQASDLMKSLKAVKSLRDAGDASPAAEALAEWMGPLIRDVWARLVQLSAAEVNKQWKSRRQAWRLQLDSDPSPKVYHRIFGIGGKYEEFRGEVLDRFFTFDPFPAPRELPGLAMLEAEDSFAEFLQLTGTIGGDVFDDSGAFVQERLELELGLAGDANPSGLVIEFLPKTKEAIVSDEFRNSDRGKNFTFVWSPEDCRGFRFTVELPDGKKKVKLWEGDWAVARAFEEAEKDEQTRTYIWSFSEEGIGTWEVHLQVKGAEPGLVRVLKATDGESPVKRVAERMPTQIVTAKSGGE
ncbi:MAG: type VI secretion protein IcmF/TssM N-terminal domain-containing protein [Planctomycetota bacterium]